MQLRAESQTILHRRHREVCHVIPGVVGRAEAGEGEVCRGDGVVV